ncbi:2,3-dihydroxybenzoate-AMP ligase [Falsiruegeria litorea R37]|uniref:2,3-dihydroxybenzoate-AMP ligase n=1 Tax=Falsiruegeria litorea R37 TaxID=1200284 RepID=A0A1Y5SIN9_9RHOB|nr:AMP-binding protein [Falsiruegeria litorea]SLN41688.1 2,3-dihydroxybenzoate-AMP ligase [Falsiruegeria litorea R37]
MHDIALTRSEFPIQDDEVILETTVGGLLREVAQSAPDQLALVEVDETGANGRQWAYGALYQDAERIALALSTRYHPGERVCVWAPNIPEWVLLEYACALAGLTLVTANPAYQAQELAYVLEQSRSVALFRTASFRGNPMADIAAQAVQGLPNLRDVVDLEDWGALLAQGQISPQLPTVAPDDAAQIQYTSGTTGFPKGAVLGHRGITNNARFYAKRTGATPGAPWATMMPLFHTAGCGMAVLGALQSKSPLFLIKMFAPEPVLEVFEREKIAASGGVPTMVVAMLEVMKHRSFDLSALETFMSGGSMVAPDLVEKITSSLGCVFQTVYGQTECSPLVTQHHGTEPLEVIATTVGQPMPQTEVSIRSTGDNSVVAIGEVGEICVRGYCTMLKYNDNPEATAATIDTDGWLHTGDLGTMDAQGYVAVTGRVKEMIIRGGENLFPAEIENVLLTHASVAEVAVVGLPDDTWGEVVAAFIRPDEGFDVDPDVLKAHCREALAAIKTPVVWSKVNSFPLTGSGKIRKFSLRDSYLNGELHHV